MSNYLVFTDETGSYIQYDMKGEFRKAHPFYIRSNVIMSADDYREYQLEINAIHRLLNLPINEEIKWSDLWLKTKGRPRTNAIDAIQMSTLKGYYRKIFEIASKKQSIKYVFTITFLYDKSCTIKSENVYKFHFQDAFQRISMELNDSDFAIVIMDELGKDDIKVIKDVCHQLAIEGDYLQYNNIYQGVLTENSIYSPGIQLADYSAGVFNGFLRGNLLDRGKYLFATDLYKKYVKPYIRTSEKGEIVGYGVLEVPGRETVRKKLEQIFD